MSGLLLRLATAIVRGWTWLYTRGAQPELRDRRRAEIESDLWEGQHDAGRTADGASLALHLIARLVAGIPDDLGWTIEQATTTGRFPRWAGALAMAASGLSLALWLIFSPGTTPLPDAPPAPPLGVRRALDYPAPPPPPPPPPPCSPAALRRTDARDCLR